jgi:glycosyltransferase involved in cell wall biosynthesis
LVSVLIPVYNASEFLKEAVSSILNQSFLDIEVILVDDCSTDNSVELIKSFTDQRIRIVELAENRGIGGALNVGLAIATGKYILRMDADDIALPDRIAKQVEFMENHPEIGVSGALAQFFDGANFNSSIPQEQLKPNLLLDCVFAHPTVIIRKSILDSYGIEFSGYLEDYELWVKLSSLTEFGLLSEVVLQYRRSENQFTATNLEKRTNEANKIRAMFAEKWLGRSLSSIEFQMVSAGGFNPNPNISQVIDLCEELLVTNPWSSKNAAINAVKKFFLRNFYRTTIISKRDSLKILNCSFLGLREKNDLIVKSLQKKLAQ